MKVHVQFSRDPDSIIFDNLLNVSCRRELTLTRTWLSRNSSEATPYDGRMAAFPLVTSVVASTRVSGLDHDINI